MKMKKNNVALGIILIVIIYNIISFLQYDYMAKYTVESQMAKAIINVEKDEMINQKICENSFPIEYNFSVNNYNDTSINEVEFDYIIEIENSTDNFPISYVLKDCDNNKEIDLIDGKSETLKISKNVKESRKFKLYINWKELDIDLADKLQIRLKINVVQSKLEVLNEA